MNKILSPFTSAMPGSINVLDKAINSAGLTIGFLVHFLRLSLRSDIKHAEAFFKTAGCCVDPNGPAEAVASGPACRAFQPSAAEASRSGPSVVVLPAADFTPEYARARRERLVCLHTLSVNKLLRRK
ncbi:unnamed protein product [Arctia plantaginis]|uniref:Uncharacterized protein n=1 Tax=Arctia plantaginis TaxID=874455 RepID=A0A8S0ZKZ2_ARCPL|nr:unnamed protein product [Arctia plantaginis]CAB3253313.1 unnamed protein product [Arctia plantaginis]